MLSSKVETDVLTYSLMPGAPNVVVLVFLIRSFHSPRGRTLPIMPYTGRLRPKGVPFSDTMQKTVD